MRTPTKPKSDILRRLEAKEVVIGFGHPVYTIADPRNEVIKGVAKRLSRNPLCGPSSSRLPSAWSR